MKQLINGVEIEMTAEEVAALEALRASVTPDADPIEAQSPQFTESMLTAGLAALGFNQEQIAAFFLAARS